MKANQTAPGFDDRTESDLLYSIVFGAVAAGVVAWQFGDDLREYLLYAAGTFAAVCAAARALFALISIDRHLRSQR